MPNHVTNELTCELATTMAALAGDEKRPCIDFNTVVPMPPIFADEPDCAVVDWAEICLGLVNLTTLRQSHRDPVESFKAGNYGDATAVLKQSNNIRMMTEGPFPMSFDDKRFEQLINCMRGLKFYGNASWHDWSIANWGTKWNAYQQKQIMPTCIRFETANSPPLKFLYALSQKYPAETFRLRWADEDFGYNTGDVTLKGGELIAGDRLKNNSDESHKLALELVHDGEIPDDHKWESNRLVYVDEEAAV